MSSRMFVSISQNSSGSTVVAARQNATGVSNDMISDTVIDLTHDTPPRRSSRTSRFNSGESTESCLDMPIRRTRRVGAHRQNNIVDESVIIIDGNQRRNRRHRNVQVEEERGLSPPNVIDLEESTSGESDGGNIPRYVPEQSGPPVLLTCPICLEALISSLKPTSTACGHIYCAKCLKMAYRRSKKCPVCQAPARIKDFIRLHF